MPFYFSESATGGVKLVGGRRSAAPMEKPPLPGAHHDDFEITSEEEREDFQKKGNFSCAQLKYNHLIAVKNIAETYFRFPYKTQISLHVSYRHEVNSPYLCPADAIVTNRHNFGGTASRNPSQGGS